MLKMNNIAIKYPEYIWDYAKRYNLCDSVSVPFSVMEHAYFNSSFNFDELDEGDCKEYAALAQFCAILDGNAFIGQKIRYGKDKKEIEWSQMYTPVAKSFAFAMPDNYLNKYLIESFYQEIGKDFFEAVPEVTFFERKMLEPLLVFSELLGLDDTSGYKFIKGLLFASGGYSGWNSLASFVAPYIDELKSNNVLLSIPSKV